MKKIALTLRLKRRVYRTKFSLWKHKVQYSIYQRPDSALFWLIMFGLFLAQVMLYFGGR